MPAIAALPHVRRARSWYRFASPSLPHSRAPRNGSGAAVPSHCRKLRRHCSTRTRGEPETVNIESDDADLSREGTSILTGNVHLQRGSRHLRAERLVYEHETEEASAEGGVAFWSEGLFLEAERAEIGLAEERALAERARFVLRDAHASGGAQRISLEGRKRMVVEDGHYTTCNPGDETWVLEAGKIEIDREKQVGAAYDVWIRVRRVPVFYAPFLTFPLSDERKSGFLPPPPASRTRAGSSSAPPTTSTSPRTGMRPWAHDGFTNAARWRAESTDT